MHHVFDGGWIWILRFNNGVTSAGISATDGYADNWGFVTGPTHGTESCNAFRFCRIAFEMRRPFNHSLTYLAYHFAVPALRAGTGRCCRPLRGLSIRSCRRDFHSHCSGSRRIAEILEARRDARDYEALLQEYAVQTDAELVATGRLIAALYANMNNFPVFVSLSLLYFAAASFSETARRLESQNWRRHFSSWPSDIWTGMRRFVGARSKYRDRGRSVSLSKDILRAIEPINIAGLGTRIAGTGILWKRRTC